jgi:glycosyltransferase involved in cell wall biosynthesis
MSRIIIYNYSMDEKSDVLASNVDWVKSFAQIFETVQVYTFKNGEADLPKNVTVRAISGGSLTNRTLGVIQLLLSFIQEIPNRRNVVVFHHMNSITAGTIGYLFKVMGVSQGLWYSHSHADIYLKLSRFSMDAFFSTTLDSFPLARGNMHPIGHGINLRRFNLENSQRLRTGIVAVGRIAPIKRLELLIQAVSESNLDIPLNFVGKYQENSHYFEMLRGLAQSLRVQVNFVGPLEYSEIPEVFASHSIVFSGTPKSIDKSALEGAASGCFVLTDNDNLDELTGMKQVYSLLNLNYGSSIKDKIITLTKLPSEEQYYLRRKVSNKTSQECNVSNATLRIARTLLEIDNGIDSKV